MNRLTIALAALLLIVCQTHRSFAQQASQLRLNEVLVSNATNYVDRYGNHSPWIEIYNNSAATVDIKGCFLTDDPANLKKYPIPKGDVLTRISPRQHLLFWADAMPTRGNFHLNFTLSPDKDTFIALVDADGKTIIDSINIRQGLLRTDESYGRKVDGVGGIGGTQGGWIVESKVTPETNNVTLDSNEKIDRLKREDQSGIIMTITAMFVVFLALLLLTVAYRYIGRYAVRKAHQRAVRIKPDKPLRIRDTAISGEISAAIAASLYALLDEAHDLEETVITIHRVERKYSPWSSKLHNMRELPMRSGNYRK